MHSQNNEALIVSKYFGDYIGTVLDLGCNDGLTFSNSYDLIQKGWSAYLIDASEVSTNKAKLLHEGNGNVTIGCFAMGERDGVTILHESGAHVPNGKDYGLVSTLKESEMERWAVVSFKDITVSMICFDTYWANYKQPTFDFITMDIEGYETVVLPQIDLSKVGCKCLCIEWNSKPELAEYYTDYCAQFGLREIHRNAENIIYAL